MPIVLASRKKSMEEIFDSIYRISKPLQSVFVFPFCNAQQKFVTNLYFFVAHVQYVFCA